MAFPVFNSFACLVEQKNNNSNNNNENIDMIGVHWGLSDDDDLHHQRRHHHHHQHVQHHQEHQHYSLTVAQFVAPLDKHLQCPVHSIKLNWGMLVKYGDFQGI